MVKDLQSLSSETKSRLNALEKDIRTRHSALYSSVKDIAKKQKQMDEEQREERDA